jgi:2-acylglycerol O-acyltransferase 2
MYGQNFDTLFPGVETRVLAASPMFYLPGAREICLWMGAVSPIARAAGSHATGASHALRPCWSLHSPPSRARRMRCSMLTRRVLCVCLLVPPIARR